MERLRQAEAQSSSKVVAMDTDAGLGAMRAALAATEAAVSKQAIAKNKEVDDKRLPTRRGQSSSPVAAQGSGQKAGWRAWSRPPGVFVFNQDKTSES